MNDERTLNNPLLALGAVRTRRYISPCCTASVDEFRMPDGTLRLIGHVIGHGYSAPWHGWLEEINDAGTIINEDGSETRCYYNPARDPWAS